MSGFRIDQAAFAKWEKAIVEYSVAANKDVATAINRQALNLSIQGLKLTKEAERGDIQSLESKPFWPKVVASVMVKRGAARAATRIAKAKTVKGQARAAARFTSGRIYTRKQVQVMSRKLIRSRLRAVKFVKAFWVAMGQACQPYAGGGRGVTGKMFKGFAPRIVPATKQRPRLDVSVEYTYKRRGSKTARRTEKILDRILQRALPASVRDMERYIQRKVQKTARAHSGA